MALRHAARGVVGGSVRDGRDGLAVAGFLVGENLAKREAGICDCKWVAAVSLPAVLELVALALTMFSSMTKLLYILSAELGLVVTSKETEGRPEDARAEV